MCCDKRFSPDHISRPFPLELFSRLQVWRGESSKLVVWYPLRAGAAGDAAHPAYMRGVTSVAGAHLCLGISTGEIACHPWKVLEHLGDSIDRNRKIVHLCMFWYGRKALREQEINGKAKPGFQILIFRFLTLGIDDDEPGDVFGNAPPRDR